MDNEILINFNDYDKAQGYYLKLKNKMIDNIFRSNQIKLTVNQTTAEAKEALETAIISSDKATQSQSSFSKANKLFKDIEEKIARMIETESLEPIRTLIMEIDNQVGTSEKTAEEKLKQLKKLLKENQEKVLKSVCMTRQVFEDMIRTSVGDGDISDITNHAISYFTNFLYLQLSKSNILYINTFARKLSVAGFYHEAGEYEALKRKLQGLMGIKVMPVGAKKTELDNVITFLDNIDSVMEGNESLHYIIDSGNYTDLEQELLQQIQWYGQQVKSWNLDKGMPTYKIGSRKSLWDRYLEENNSKYNTLQSAQFLSRFENILQALGPSNVLFTAGQNRYFMNDFIKSFREKKYVLVFYRKNLEEPMSQEIALESYLTARNQLRKKFASN